MIHCYAQTWIALNRSLVIAQSPIEAMNRAFREKPQADNANVLIMLGAVGGAVLLTAVIAWYMKVRGTGEINDCWKLFHEICRAHSLTWSERRKLGAFAKSQRLDDPCALLINADLWSFEGVAKGRFLKPKYQREITALQRVLFTTH